MFEDIARELAPLSWALACIDGAELAMLELVAMLERRLRRVQPRGRIHPSGNAQATPKPT